MAQPFDFNALLQNPAFQFGTSLMGSARAPNAVGNAYGVIGKMQALKQEQALQQAQIQNMEQMRKEAEARAIISAGQLDRQNGIADRAAATEERKQKLVDQFMAANPDLFGGAAAPATGAQGESLNYNIPPGGQPPGQPPMDVQQPIGNFNPDDPRDVAGPFSSRGGFGAPSMQPNARPMLKASIPDNIMNGLEHVESGGNPNALGPPIPSLGGDRAIGPYQFVPGTIAMLRSQGIKFDPRNKEQSRAVANHYLSGLVEQNGGNFDRGLAQYGGHKNPDSPAAQAYVQKVKNAAGEADGGAAPGSPIPVTGGMANPGIKEMRKALAMGVLGIPGAMQQQEMAKMLAPQNVTPGSYLRGPDGQMQYVPDPKQAVKDAQEQQRIHNEDIRVANDTARTKDEQARTQAAIDEKNLKATQAKEADLSGYQDVKTSMDRLLSTTDKLLAHPGLRDTTGKSGIVKLYNLSQSGRDAAALKDSVKNKMVIDTLLKMKALSRNGSSGFGQLSDKEGARLETYIANLSNAQSYDQTKAALQDIRTFANDTKSALGDRLHKIYGADVETAAPANAPAGDSGVLSLDQYISKHKK